MEIELLRETTRYFKRIFNAAVTSELGAECVVPDDCPEAGEVYLAEGCALLKGKEASAGVLSVRGSVKLSVLYASGADGALSRLETETPFAVETACGDADENCRLSAGCALASCEVRRLTSRKLYLRLEILTELECWKEDELLLRCLPAGENPDLEQKIRKEQILAAQSITERSFVVTDEIRLGGEKKPASEILLYSARLEQEPPQSVGSKLIVKGTAEIGILYRSVDGEVCRTQAETEFSQIMETDVAGSDRAEVRLALTGVIVNPELSLSPEERTILAELHIAAQCAAYVQLETEWLQDAYAIAVPAMIGREEIEISVPGSRRQLTAQISGSVPSAGGNGNVLYAAARCGKFEIAGEPGARELRGTVEVAALSVSDGVLRAGTARIPVLEPCEPEEDAVLGAGTAEIFAAGTPEGAEIRGRVTIPALEHSARREDAVTSLRLDESARRDPRDFPSLILRRCGEGDTLWEIAKSAGSTETLVIAANDLDPGEALPCGKLLILPRRR